MLFELLELLASSLSKSILLFTSELDSLSFVMIGVRLSLGGVLFKGASGCCALGLSAFMTDEVGARLSCAD